MLLCGAVANGAEVFLWEPLAPEDPGNYDRNEGGPRGDWLPGSINIIGSIEEGDLQKLIAALQDQEYMPGIAISSPGGDVVEAMEIGRFLRDSKLDITVNDNAQCAGACFLAVVGATGRYVRAPVGIHALRMRTGLDASVREYLDEMHVPEDVVAETMSTAPAEESYLSPAEFRLRVGQHPPAFEEWKVASCGEMTADEKLLYDGVVALRNYEKHYEGKDPALYTDDEKAWLRYSAGDIKVGRSLSESVKERLTNKHHRVNNCVLPIEKEHDRKVLEAMKNIE
jgi:hypothetical protein